jgi:hypothetical protein
MVGLLAAERLPGELDPRAFSLAIQRRFPSKGMPASGKRRVDLLDVSLHVQDIRQAKDLASFRSL